MSTIPANSIKRWRKFMGLLLKIMIAQSISNIRRKTSNYKLSCDIPNTKPVLVTVMRHEIASPHGEKRGRSVQARQPVPRIPPHDVVPPMSPVAEACEWETDIRYTIRTRRPHTGFPVVPRQDNEIATTRYARPPTGKSTICPCRFLV